MPAQIQYQADDIFVLRISGILKRSEFGAEQSALARNIDIGSKPRLLVILEGFEGWEPGADWNDLDLSSRMPTRFPRSPSSPSHVGKLLRSLLPEHGSAAHQSSFFRLTTSSRREAGWRNRASRHRSQSMAETQPQLQPALLEIVGDYFPVLHSMPCGITGYIYG